MEMGLRLFLFTILLISLVSANVNIPIAVSSFNNNTANVNNSLYWQGHAFTFGQVSSIEADPFWTANYSLYNSSWSSTANSSYVPYNGATTNVNLSNSNISASYYFGNGSQLTGIDRFNQRVNTTSNVTFNNANITTLSKGSIVYSDASGKLSGNISAMFYNVTNSRIGIGTNDTPYTFNMGTSANSFAIKLAPPVLVSLKASTTAGSLTAGTYYIIMQQIDTLTGIIGVTTPSNELSVVIDGVVNTSIDVNWTGTQAFDGYYHICFSLNVAQNATAVCKIVYNQGGGSWLNNFKGTGDDGGNPKTSNSARTVTFSPTQAWMFSNVFTTGATTLFSPTSGVDKTVLTLTHGTTVTAGDSYKILIGGQGYGSEIESKYITGGADFHRTDLIFKTNPGAVGRREALRLKWSGETFMQNSTGIGFPLTSINATSGSWVTPTTAMLDVNGTGRFRDNLTAPNICYSNGTNCNLNTTGIINTQSNYSIGGVIGLTQEFTFVCFVDLVGLTSKKQNITFTGGIATSNTTCV